MKTICLLSQKGGSGKSTIACSLAVCADSHDQGAVIIDLDPQSTATKWSERRDEKSPFVIPAQPIKLGDVIEEAREAGADIVLIDTAPHSTGAVSKAIELADLVLIPCRASVNDIDAIENSVQIAGYHKKDCAVVINGLPPNAPNVFKDAKQAITESYGVKVLPTAICQRSDFVHSATEGKTPTDYAPNGKASGEIEALYQHIMSNGAGLLSRLFSK